MDHHQHELDGTDPLECLDGPAGCLGPVFYRQPLSSTGRSFPRCSHHWEQRLDAQETISRHYPDSPIPPDWYDPAYAGERWGEDD